jgi:hypothetical protein
LLAYGARDKSIRKINSNADKHAIAYNQVANYYKGLTGFDFDQNARILPDYVLSLMIQIHL